MSKDTTHDKLAFVEPSITQPALGRRIALELRPARPATWLGPAWATLCGVVASGAFVFSGQDVLRLLVAILLTDPLLGAWRAAWVNTDWRAPVRAWRPTPTRSWMLLPYARMDSPAARVSQWISSRGKFWRSALWPEVGQSISALVVSGFIALTVALVLSPTAFTITLVALALAPIEAELGTRTFGQIPRALAEIGAAWMIGHSALARPTWQSFALALFFALGYRGVMALASSRDLGFAIANLSQVLVGGVLLITGALVHAGIVGICLVAQILWQSLARHLNEYHSTYLPRVQWFMLAAMLAAALGAAH